MWGVENAPRSSEFSTVLFRLPPRVIPESTGGDDCFANWLPFTPRMADHPRPNGWRLLQTDPLDETNTVSVPRWAEEDGPKKKPKMPTRSAVFRRR